MQFGLSSFPIGRSPFASLPRWSIASSFPHLLLPFLLSLARAFPQRVMIARVLSMMLILSTPASRSHLAGPPREYDARDSSNGLPFIMITHATAWSPYCLYFG